MSVSRHTNFKKGKTSDTCITFGEDDYGSEVQDHDDPVVILGVLANCEVKRIFIEQGSSADIIFSDLFEKLGLKREVLTPPPPPQGDLVGFTGDRIVPKGHIELRLTLGLSPL